MPAFETPEASGRNEHKWVLWCVGKSNIDARRDRDFAVGAVIGRATVRTPLVARFDGGIFRFHPG